MTNRVLPRHRLVLVVLCTALVGLIPLSITVGARPIPPGEVWRALTHFDTANSLHLLVVKLRLPRALLAAVVGAGLGAAGTVMQAVTRNPLADPGILGVNAGAAAAIALSINLFGFTQVTGYMWFGLAGAALAGSAVYILGGVRRGTNPIRLVLAGAALSVVLLSITQVLLVNSDDLTYHRYRHWVTGSLEGRDMAVLVPTALLTMVGMGVALSLARSLDSAVLGEDLRRALGGHPRRMWTLAALSVVVLSGAATAAAGPLGFVGLAAPHLARRVGGSNHRMVLPWSMLLGALLTLGADTLGRVVGHPGEASVGIMVSLIGGPFFIVLVRRRRLVQL